MKKTIKRRRSTEKMDESPAPQPSKRRDFFRRVARSFSDLVGSPGAFILALGTILIWILSGPFFAFSDTWQLIINTATTIITFLMVFLIQNAQNRDAKAIHLKLDELLKGVKGSRTELVDLEEMTDEELQQLQDEFKSMHEQLSKHLSERQREAAIPKSSHDSKAPRS